MLELSFIHLEKLLFHVTLFHIKYPTRIKYPLIKREGFHYRVCFGLVLNTGGPLISKSYRAPQELD